MKDRIYNFFGSAFYLGLMPIAPGSFAALLGLFVHLVAAYLFPEHLQHGLIAAAFFLCCIGHYLLHDWAIEFWQDPDPGNFVLDEVAGYLIVPLMFPYGEAWKVGFIGFLLFRVIDIIKIPPADAVDRDMHNVWGVILDDWIAGMYAAFLLYVLMGVGLLWSPAFSWMR